MYFYSGYGNPGFGAYGGIWDDTQEWVLTNLPSWATGVTAVDVPEGEEGVQQLMEMAPELNGKILLSARAQYALWTVYQREAATLDEMFAATADIGGATGESIRANLESQRQEIIRKAQELATINNSALEQGVPPAIAGEWLPEESARTGAAAALLTNPEFLVFAGGAIIIASVILAGAITISWAVGKWLDLEEQKIALANIPDPEGKLQYLLERTKSKPGGGFPWPWVIGIGAAGVLVVLGVAWAEGTLGRWTERLRAGPSKRATTPPQYGPRR